MVDTTIQAATDNRGRAELLHQVAAAMRRQLPGGDLDRAIEFLGHYAAGLATDALTDRTGEDLAAAVLSLWSFAQRREPGRARIRVFNPRAQGEGWGSAHAVIEIVNDDMPFLVESALGTLQRVEQPVHLLVHPVLPVARDGEGRLTAIGAVGGGVPSGEAAETLRSESIIQIEFGPEADESVLRGIADVLDQAMAEARTAVADFEPMLYAVAAVKQAMPPGPERDFLDWIGDGNFVLLGTSEVALTEAGDLDAHAPHQSLGVLRDPQLCMFDVLRDPALWRRIAGDALGRFDTLGITKADVESRVHRPQLYDVVVCKRRDAAGRVTALAIFAGQFVADAYNRNPRSIPLLREKVEAILREAGVDPTSHDGRALRNVLDTWPRDDLFQGTTGEILAAARRVMQLQVRPQVALFLRHDLLSRHISAIVFVPRDQFDTGLRLRLAAMVNRATRGELAGYAISLGDGPLARVHFIVAADPAEARALDVRALEAAMTEAARSFRERLAEALADEHGEARAASILIGWRTAFPADYSERTPATVAVRDIAMAEEALAAGTLRLALGRPFGLPGHRLLLKLFQAGEHIALSDIVPLIESLGLRVIEEAPFLLTPRHGSVALQELTLETADRTALDLAERGTAITEAIAATRSGDAEVDGFNRLVLRAGLSWREAWLLRAMFKWCRQVRAPFSQSAVETALAAHPQATRTLIDLFHARFDPSRARDAARETELETAFDDLLDKVESPDEDRILRRFRRLLDAVLRAGFHDTARKVIALKIDSAKAGDMPLPRPWVEIFVHGARMEGCHLRGGKVARGGIRWSDRRDDFRTEILGLMKAQMVKNVVIVPVGAKGGFVLKRPPAPTGDAAADREAQAAEGIACYKLLINAMLDITDNLRAGEIVPPEGVVRRDGDDPYLVVAADKGTATFSDTANGIAIERGFWLGDAFASGGSVGYDHKAMGITARGAWVNIAWHFHELGHDIQREDFTCAGVGDMSGDVFGNGLLVSRHTKLRAAFDHRHIFLDPDPDPEASHDERKRLFDMGRSSWADYDTAKLSEGGGVHPRHAKSLTLSEPAATMLGLEAGAQEPAAVMRAILTMPVDLLYFGGIGTYVKAAAESQADAGDRANDAIRVNGGDLRARVLGEGANLAVTQAGRIEAAQDGVRLNTDALDNSAGVSTSDHEVNIKILLADAMESGGLTDRQRVELLESMTDEVAALVLRDNRAQSIAISLDAAAGPADLPAQNALMGLLETAGILDRTVAGLPDAAAIATRASFGQGLTRPELCALMAHAKLHLAAVIDASGLPDDPALAGLAPAYFPAPLPARFATEIGRHRLKRELIGTAVSNDLINRMGAAAFGRLAGEAGVDLVEAAEAALVAGLAFDLQAIHDSVDRLDGVPAAAERAVLLAARRLQEAAARTLLGALRRGGSIETEVRALQAGIATLTDAALDRARGSEAAARLSGQGLPERLAAFAAALPDLEAAPMIVRLAAAHGADVEAAQSAWDAAGRAAALDPLRSALGQITPQGAWGARAVVAFEDDIATLQAHLAGAALARQATPETVIDETGHGAGAAVALARDAAAAPDLAAFAVALRALRRALQTNEGAPA